MATDIGERARRIRLLLFDVDGVLTDGKILLHADGSESKSFDIRDGTGIVLAQRAGLRTGLLSARHSGATAERAAQLRIPIVRQGSADKLETLEEIIAAEGISAGEVAFMGDDLLDLPVIEHVGLAAAPVDAADEVRSRAHWIATRRGGDGAVRELIEMVLKAQGRWDGIVASFIEAPSRA
jgi:3-deoxy-D-manno-octulosonate 8-phosphate phosphatase (KDO 8-P phosphatase)